MSERERQLAEVNDMVWTEEQFVSNQGGKIEFENVSFSYNETSQEPVLKNVTFTCMPGETIGIIGKTGAGKSSLVSLIPRLYDATSGTIKLNDSDIREIEPKAIRERIAIVAQKAMLFTGTIGDNIRWGREDASKEEVQLAAEIADANGFIQRSTEGYETEIGQGGVNLSGGQKQRVSIARALIKKPEILILDDSTSAVDMVTEGKIKQSLQRYADNITCILVSQRISTVADADRILVVDNGEIVGSGKHDELLKTCQAYQEIYESQFEKEVR